MGNELYRQLAWLPIAPSNFRQLCRNLAKAGDPVGRVVRGLATHALDENGLRLLAKAVAGLQSRGADLTPLIPFRLGLVSNGTTDLLGHALIATAARHGFLLEIVVAHFGQTLQEALAPESKLNRARLDAVLLAVDYHALPALGAPGSVADAVGFVGALRDGFHRNGTPVCIVQTFAPPVEALFGHLDRSLAISPRGAIDAINRELALGVAGTQDVLFDVAALAETVGLADWHAPNQWNLAKLPFDQAFVPLYADHVGRLIGAMKGRSRRCLILDLDNTLWGGVIGDDGMDGIHIAQGDAVGEAFLTTQAAALALRARGAVLAVSSKNTDAVARQVFREHPEMLLREEHIAVFQANWKDKATNILSIAEALSLGLESMVFLDDNPVERDLVRQMLPDVAVPELPTDPAFHARTLLAAGYFEAIVFSEEDRKRADFYQDNAKRVVLQAEAGDLEAYLESLKMEISFAPFDVTGRARIAQLIAKSNQFNLTTRRYGEADVAKAEADPDVLTLQIRLTDAFGDNGMISVVICRPRDRETWEIDTWLMSCRVLGRRVEQMVLRELVHTARERNIKQLIGIYIPTERNGLVTNHYLQLGFTELGTANAMGKTEWTLDTSVEVPPAPMRVHRTGEFADRRITA